MKGDGTFFDVTGKNMVPYTFDPLGYERAFTSDTFVGIEIECENCSSNSNKADPDLRKLYKVLWVVKDDGSLRNNGLEWVTPAGITAGDATIALRVLEKYFKEIMPNIQANARTGVHIHVNFNDKTPEQLGSLIALYSVFEKSLFAFCGGRTKNGYCVPVRHSATAVPDTLRLIAQGPVKPYDVWRMCRNVPKYSAMNLGAMSEFGSVEFRHAQGTVNPAQDVIPWLHVIVSLYEYAVKQDFTKVVNRIKELNSNSQYNELAKEIFPPVFFERINRDALIHDMKHGCSAIKEWLAGREDNIEQAPPPRRARGPDLPAWGDHPDDEVRPPLRQQVDRFSLDHVNRIPLPEAITADDGTPMRWRVMPTRAGTYELVGMLGFETTSAHYMLSTEGDRWLPTNFHRDWVVRRLVRDQRRDQERFQQAVNAAPVAGVEGEAVPGGAAAPRPRFRPHLPARDTVDRLIRPGRARVRGN